MIFLCLYLKKIAVLAIYLNFVCIVVRWKAVNTNVIVFVDNFLRPWP